MNDDKNIKDMLKALQEAPDYDTILNILCEMPTIHQIIVSGTGHELDNLSSSCNFKTKREEDEDDSSFREKLCAEYSRGVWRFQEGDMVDSTLTERVEEAENSGGVVIVKGDEKFKGWKE